ncbi:MAG: hypothetical protein LBG76_02605 [Treponema sp.]|jgi:hypothetical protein|nr:hypothetical protein [Treponema sp.]
MRKRTSSIVTFSIALACIVVYATALLYGALRMYLNVTERQNSAEREFYDLADLASSAGMLGFMDTKFQETVQDALAKSGTLQAVIISSPGGEFAFEKERNSTINWVGDSPRFIQKFGVSSKALFAPLRIDGLRNVTISAVSQYLDYDYFIIILKQTLLAVLSALVLGFVTLLLESMFFKNRETESEPSKPQKYKKERIRDHSREQAKSVPEPEEEEAAPEEEALEAADDDFDFDFTEPELNEAMSEPVLPEPDSQAEDFDIPDAAPQGLYSPRSNIGWEAYTKDRLESELHRSASFEQDLTVIGMEYQAASDAELLYKELADAAVEFFNLQDLTFEQGKRGITVIIPNIDLNAGLAKAEAFHNRLPISFTDRADLSIGLSSRSGRLVNAERLLFETAKALERASKDPHSPIVAFKTDPEKYRAFVASQKQRQRTGS